MDPLKTKAAIGLTLILLLELAWAAVVPPSENRIAALYRAMRRGDGVAIDPLVGEDCRAAFTALWLDREGLGDLRRRVTAASRDVPEAKFLLEWDRPGRRVGLALEAAAWLRECPPLPPVLPPEGLAPAHEP